MNNKETLVDIVDDLTEVLERKSDPELQEIYGRLVAWLDDFKKPLNPNVIRRYNLATGEVRIIAEGPRGG